ncbi:hypothetical protein GPEL0_01f0823 [Geoanaerobacter pelophilus]|uniref:Uncharacterized protein n=1 Tax=Geoanaerobacter pelophilus TaxID=60036 RepID=A0ABQ0MI12_9BACT|nr:hypothetical protein GPEL0_01f0823 [Geoanaerobacter pelophilus]
MFAHESALGTRKYGLTLHVLSLLNSFVIVDRSYHTNFERKMSTHFFS